MKKILTFIIIGLFVCSCSKDEIKTYDADNFIYFAPLIIKTGIYSLPIWDTVQSFSFFYYPKRDTVIDIIVNGGGFVVNHDRYFNVKTTATTDGGDARNYFDEIPVKHVFPAGATNAKIPVHIYNHADLLTKEVSIRMELEPCADFTLDYINKYIKSDTVNRLNFTLNFTSRVSQPAIWKQRETQGIGYFSPTKFYLISEMYDVSPADWQDTGSKFWQNFNAYLGHFGTFLKLRIVEGPEAAIKDLDAKSIRGYMGILGFPYFGIPTTEIPDSFTTVDGWEGNLN